MNDLDFPVRMWSEVTFKSDLLDPAELIIPPKWEGPVEGLHKTHGYECSVCGKSLGEETSMIKHSQNDHDWNVQKWTQKWMQLHEK